MVGGPDEMNQVGQSRRAFRRPGESFEAVQSYEPRWAATGRPDGGNPGIAARELGAAEIDAEDSAEWMNSGPTTARPVYASHEGSTRSNLVRHGCLSQSGVASPMTFANFGGASPIYCTSGKQSTVEVHHRDK
jgi:hypothetical protein